MPRYLPALTTPDVRLRAHTNLYLSRLVLLELLFAMAATQAQVSEDQVAGGEDGRVGTRKPMMRRAGPAQGGGSGACAGQERTAFRFSCTET